MSAFSNVFVTFTVLAIVNVVAEVQSCPHSCRCDRRNAVFCNERNLVLIPYGIPVTTRTLHLQINNVTNGRTTEEILSGLKRLRKLDLHQNMLTSVPKGLPNSLEYVDLRINRIKYVGKTSLRGMASLQELQLDQNNITNQGLSPLAFQDTKNLEVLHLSDNLLTAFPDDLPVSLRVLRLENNLIQVISRRSIQRLSNLIDLDLSQNAITQTRIEVGAMSSLAILRRLDFSDNHFTELPRDLPYNLNNLMLSNNQIEYIYKEKNEEHGSLRRLRELKSIDLSANNLKSVQALSFNFLNLRSVELHNNPWQCDCHLHYLKQWLSSTESTVSSESSIRCNSPSAFSDVTLNSIDEEALNCNSRTKTRDMMKITDVSSSGFQLQWHGPAETPDPPFIKRSLMYGPLKCKNCSIQGSALAEQSLRGDATSFMENYSSQDITIATQQNPTNASVFVSRLQSDKHYAVCVLDSQQDDNTISTNQCIDVWTDTNTVTSTPHQEDAVFLPLWLIVFCCIIVLLIFILVIVVIVWKRRSALKSKTPRLYSQNRDTLYYPQDYLPGFSRSIGYRPSLPPQGYGTSLSERTYATCGPASTTQRTEHDSAVDARMEFEVLIKPTDNTTPKGLHTPSSSYSENQENNTLSTSQTGRSSTHEFSSTSSPTYDALHSYTPLDQRSSVANGSITPSHGHDPGSYV